MCKHTLFRGVTETFLGMDLAKGIHCLCNYKLQVHAHDESCFYEHGTSKSTTQNKGKVNKIVPLHRYFLSFFVVPLREHPTHLKGDKSL